MDDSKSEREPVVLVVDDEQGLADLYAIWLRDRCRVDAAYSGEEALDRLSCETEIVFLDRRMPGFCGDDVLEAIRDRGYDCYVVMVSAVDPDLDLVDRPIDEYLTKPVSKQELLATVERLIDRDQYGEPVRTLVALLRKQAVIDANVSASDRLADERYRSLETEIQRLKTADCHPTEALSKSDYGTLLAGTTEESRGVTDE